jgi:hypothetical protein
MIMKRLIPLVVVGAVSLMSAGMVDAQTARPVTITELMSAQQREATGVRTLTPEQLEALSAWLDDYRHSLIQQAVDETGEGVVAEERIIDTRIDGDFDGWVGDTVFRLENGQIWQQTSPSAKYLFVHAPRVVISQAPFMMKVEGLQGEISVRRLK